MTFDVSMFPELESPAPKKSRYLISYEIDIDLQHLTATPEQVATFSRSRRERRVEMLMQQSHSILDKSIKVAIEAEGKQVAAIVGLFSGGNDSTTLCHLMLNRITHLAHANTTIGVEETRQFVRDTAALWQVPLLEYTAPRESDHYRSLVLAHGFPGPAHHYKMYQRLKERALNRIRNDLVKDRSQRVIYLAGRRRTESARRASVPALERSGSIVWVSPMVNWTKLDLNTYRLMRGDVPVNRVSDLIHMSGECLCGSFAHKGELDEIGEYFPDVVQVIRDLESELVGREDIPVERRTWGWATNFEPPEDTGPLCTSCDWRYHQYTVEEMLP